jgi:hypothetical protein
MIEQISGFPIRVVSHYPIPLTMLPLTSGPIVAVGWRAVLARNVNDLSVLLRTQVATARLNIRSRWQLGPGSGTQSQERRAQAMDRGEQSPYLPRRRG